MGVDTRILIKIVKPESWVNPTQLRQLSAQLTSVIGHEKFFLRPEENRHALSFVLEETRKWAEKYPKEYPDFDGNKAVWSQDGPDIVAEPNEQFIECHVWSRYYHEHYARGDWQALSFIMMWLTFNIKDSEIWYGGDSSGCCAELMTADRMRELTKFYLTTGNETYWMNSKCLYKCEFCNCGVVNSGGGQDAGFYHCESCGSQWVTTGVMGRFSPAAIHDNMQVTKYDPNGEDRDMKSDGMASFEIHRQIDEGKRKMYPFDGIFRQKYPYEAPKKKRQLKAPAKMIDCSHDISW